MLACTQCMRFSISGRHRKWRTTEPSKCIRLLLTIQCFISQRLEEMASLQDDVVRLRVLVEPLLRNKPDPRVFVKPISGNNDDSGEIERASRVVNKWSLYTAYR